MIKRVEMRHHDRPRSQFSTNFATSIPAAEDSGSYNALI
jgi:hypothetical protein